MGSEFCGWLGNRNSYTLLRQRKTNYNLTKVKDIHKNLMISRLLKIE